eukprot:TRINITY_DN7240_c0_g1_i1.p1 TRINITY_DN7240_c0_g1~~TRINITY_DN7240_c0_g1_i1.p1  ORF type:complete len:335 (+),score=5.99 TRINITY_DN7240_c0_g1_i1:234-1238(+)
MVSLADEIGSLLRTDRASSTTVCESISFEWSPSTSSGGESLLPDAFQTSPFSYGIDNALLTRQISTTSNNEGKTTNGHTFGETLSSQQQQQPQTWKPAPKLVSFSIRVPSNADASPYLFTATVTERKSLLIESATGTCRAEITRLQSDAKPLRMKVRIADDENWNVEECFRIFATIGVAAGISSGGEWWHVQMGDEFVPCKFPFCIGRQAIELLDSSWGGQQITLLRFTSRGHGGEYTSMSKYRPIAGKSLERVLGLQAPVSHPQMALVRHLAAEAATGLVRVIGAKVQWTSSVKTTAPSPSVIVSELPSTEAIHVAAPVIALHIFPVRDDPVK